MGREIKFRGKPIEDYGDIKWFYGSLILNNEDKLAYIEAPHQGTVPVEWESVGEYTGLTAKDGTEIYEGDIVLLDFGIYGVVYYDEAETSYMVHIHSTGPGLEKEYEVLGLANPETVIGNKDKNPELLEGDK